MRRIALGVLLIGLSICAGPLEGQTQPNEPIAKIAAGAEKVQAKDPSETIWAQLKRLFRYRVVRLRGSNTVPEGRIVVQKLRRASLATTSSSSRDADLSSPVFGDDGAIYAFRPNSTAPLLVRLEGENTNTIGPLPPGTVRLLAVRDTKAYVLESSEMAVGLQLVEVSRSGGRPHIVVLQGDVHEVRAVLDSLVGDDRIYSDSITLKSNDGEILLDPGEVVQTSCGVRKATCVQPALSNDNSSIAYVEIDGKQR